jgi:hypothetical protein
MKELILKKQRISKFFSLFFDDLLHLPVAGEVKNNNNNTFKTKNLKNIENQLYELHYLKFLEFKKKKKVKIDKISFLLSNFFKVCE